MVLWWKVVKKRRKKTMKLSFIIGWMVCVIQGLRKRGEMRVRRVREVRAERKSDRTPVSERRAETVAYIPKKKRLSYKREGGATKLRLTLLLSLTFLSIYVYISLFYLSIFLSLSTHYCTVYHTQYEGIYFRSPFIQSYKLVDTLDWAPQNLCFIRFITSPQIIYDIDMKDKKKRVGKERKNRTDT